MSARQRGVPLKSNYRFAGRSSSGPSASSNSHADGGADAEEISPVPLSVKWFTSLSSSKILAFISFISLIPSVVLYSMSFHQSTGLITNSGWSPSGNFSDGPAIAHGRLGYNYVCLTGEVNGEVMPTEWCSNAIDSQCHFSYPPDAVAWLQSNFGFSDTQLSNCAEFNAYRATHVVALILTSVALVAILMALIKMPLWEKHIFRLKLIGLGAVFFAGFMGVAAQCFLIDWMNFNSQYLIALGPIQAVPLPINVNIDEASFYFIAAWVLDFLAMLCYITHFPNTLATNS